jgi:hypothetical protein
VFVTSHGRFRHRLVQSISVRIWTQHLPFYSLANAISAPASAVEEGVNAVDSAFVIEYAANEGCPETRGVLRPSVTCAGYFAALMSSAGSTLINKTK